MKRRDKIQSDPGYSPDQAQPQKIKLIPLKETLLSRSNHYRLYASVLLKLRCTW